MSISYGNSTDYGEFLAYTFFDSSAAMCTCYSFNFVYFFIFILFVIIIIIIIIIIFFFLVLGMILVFLDSPNMHNNSICRNSEEIIILIHSHWRVRNS